MGAPGTLDLLIQRPTERANIEPKQRLSGTATWRRAASYPRHDLSATDITNQLRDLLDGEIDAQYDRGCLRVLTPFEYPDGDGVVVRIERAPGGRYVVSDGGDADATLVGRLRARRVDEPASRIARRYDAVFRDGQLATIVDREDDLVVCL